MTFPSASSRAQTTTTSAMVPLPIHFFCPLSTHVSPSRCARVCSATESEPCNGSVSANAPIAASLAIGGSQRCFCASEPSSAIDRIASPACTPRKVPRLPSPRLISMCTRPVAIGLSAGQPYPSMPSPTTPSSASPATSGTGNSARSQYPLMTGSTSWSTKSRVRRQISRSVGVSWSPMRK